MTFSLAADPGDPYLAGFRLDLARAAWQGSAQQLASTLGEVEASPGGMPAPVRRLHAWHALARGASNLDYLLDPRDERERAEQFAAQPMEAQAAILFDDDDLRLLDLEPAGECFSYLRHLFVFHRALARLGIQVDFPSPDTNLRPYRLVIAPTAYRVDDALAKRLNAFARWGGTVLLGVRTGAEAASEGRAEQPQPGLLRYLAGATVTGWRRLPPGEGCHLESGIPGLRGPATVWAEALKEPLDACRAEPDEAQVYRCLARYTTGPFEGQVALGAHTFGMGQAFYLGWYPTLHQAVALVAFLAHEGGIAAIHGLPEGVIAIRRGEAILLLNFTSSRQAAEVGGKPVEVGGLDIALLPG